MFDWKTLIVIQGEVTCNSQGRMMETVVKAYLTIWALFSGGGKARQWYCMACMFLLKRQWKTLMAFPALSLDAPCPPCAPVVTATMPTLPSEPVYSGGCDLEHSVCVSSFLPMEKLTVFSLVPYYYSYYSARLPILFSAWQWAWEMCVMIVIIQYYLGRQGKVTTFYYCVLCQWRTSIIIQFLGSLIPLWYGRGDRQGGRLLQHSAIYENVYMYIWTEKGLRQEDLDRDRRKKGQEEKGWQWQCMWRAWLAAIYNLSL